MGQGPKSIVRRRGYGPKVLFSILFKSDGWLWISANDDSDTVDGNYYIKNCLEPPIEEFKNQRPNTGIKGVKLLDDNTKPLVAKEVKTLL